MKTLIQNGRLVLDHGVELGDLLIDGERIVALGSQMDVQADRVIDARGCYVLPGFLDFHVHIGDRIGRFELSDTYESGSEVAVQNGITTVCAFVTQGPGNTLKEALRVARSKAEGRVYSDVLWHLTPITYEAQDWVDLEALVALGYRTIKLYTTYRAAGIYCSYARIEEVFARLGKLGVRFMIHCEDDERLAAVDPGALDLSKASANTKLRPEEAEVVAIEQLAALAAKHGVALHIVHVSTVGGAKALLDVRAKGAVSCETCPQYLWLDDSWLDRPDGHHWLCSPPLRGERETFRTLALQGAFDVFATDHCPFSRKDKDDWNPKDMRTVANGAAGLGALPHLVWKLYESDPDRAAMELALRLSRNPAAYAGVGDRKGALKAGLDADVVVLDPHGPERPVSSSLSDCYETYPGYTSRLAFRHVLLRGSLVAEDGCTVSPGRHLGQLLQRSV